jgi:hypothetical protein
MSLTIFANFRIDDQDRFERLKKSFFSFNKAKIDKWVINTRGKLKREVNKFLNENIKQNFELFNIQLKKGWFEETRSLLGKIKTDYVFIWNEDHINLKDTTYFDKVILELKICNVDTFTYSFFVKGDLPRSLEIEEAIKTNKIIYLNYNERIHEKRLNFIKRTQSKGQSYIISLVSIMKRNLFEKIVLTNDPPIKRWSKFTPFDFEKSPEDIHWLPFIFAAPREEFFRCIDKDWDKDGNVILLDKQNFAKDKIKFRKKIFMMIYKIAKFFLKPIVINTREMLNRKITNYKIKKNKLFLIK